MPVTSALERVRQEDYKFEDNQGAGLKLEWAAYSLCPKMLGGKVKLKKNIILKKCIFNFFKKFKKFIR